MMRTSTTNLVKKVNILIVIYIRDIFIHCQYKDMNCTYQNHRVCCHFFQMFHSSSLNVVSIVNAGNVAK